MATVSADRAATAVPVPQGMGGGVVCTNWGYYEIATALAAADILEFCRVPKCTVVGGWLIGDDIDALATEAFDFDVGHAANDTDGADPDAFLNGGVLTGDAPLTGGIVGIRAQFQGALTDGGVVLAETTMVQGVCNIIDATGGTGSLSCYVLYTTD